MSTQDLEKNIESLKEDIHWLNHYNSILIKKLEENGIYNWQEPNWTNDLEKNIDSLKEDIDGLNHYNSLLIKKLEENNIYKWGKPNWIKGELEKCECSLCFPSIKDDICHCPLCTGEEYNDSEDDSLIIDNDVKNYISSYKEPLKNVDQVENCGKYCLVDCKRCILDISEYGYKKTKLVNWIKNLISLVATAPERVDRIMYIKEIFKILCEEDGKMLIKSYKNLSDVVENKLIYFYRHEDLKEAYYWYRRIYGKRLPLHN